MTTSPHTSLLGQLRGAFLRRELSTASDAQLLSRYLLEREEIAFEAISARHGAMVLGVCRRILGDEHEAEDAFQAVFLVLVPRPLDRPRERLGCWLHGVARRTAQKARTARARWQARGRQAMTKPFASPDDKGVAALQPVLDEELAAWPRSTACPSSCAIWKARAARKRRSSSAGKRARFQAGSPGPAFARLPPDSPRRLALHRGPDGAADLGGAGRYSLGGAVGLHKQGGLSCRGRKPGPCGRSCSHLDAKGITDDAGRKTEIAVAGAGPRSAGYRCRCRLLARLGDAALRPRSRPTERIQFQPRRIPLR